MPFLATRRKYMPVNVIYANKNNGNMYKKCEFKGRKKKIGQSEQGFFLAFLNRKI